MGHEWIIDVIADLQRFASAHQLTQLEEQLKCTASVASSEISRLAELPCHITQGEASETRQFPANVGASGSA